LRRFAPAAKQDHHQRALSPKIRAITRPEIDSQFFDAAAHGFAIAEIAQSNPIQASSHLTNGSGILQ
jgi:hypothetical protein